MASAGHGHGTSTKTVDAVTADSKHYKVDFENDKVRVLRVNFGPGEKSLKHSHPACVVVNLTEQHSHHGHADGSHRVVKGKVGEVHYFDAVEHISENKGDEPFELLIVELKG